MELVRDHEHNMRYTEQKNGAEKEMRDITGVDVHSRVGLRTAIKMAFKYGTCEEAADVIISAIDWEHAKNELNERK